MSTSLDALRQSLATHDAALTIFLCERALCGRHAPASYLPGWVNPLYAELEAVSPGPGWVAEFVPRVEQDYLERVLPVIEQPDAPVAEPAAIRACDEVCIKALLLRLRFAVRVAESKINGPDAPLRAAAISGDAAGLNRCITHAAVEQAVMDRVRGYANDFARRRHLSGDLAERLASALVLVYRDWLIPLSRDVQVAWLIAQARRFAVRD